MIILFSPIGLLGAGLVLLLICALVGGISSFNDWSRARRDLQMKASALLGKQENLLIELRESNDDELVRWWNWATTRQFLRRLIPAFLLVAPLSTVAAVMVPWEKIGISRGTVELALPAAGVGLPMAWSVAMLQGRSGRKKLAESIARRIGRDRSRAAAKAAKTNT